MEPDSLLLYPKTVCVWVLSWAKRIRSTSYLHFHISLPPRPCTSYVVPSIQISSLNFLCIWEEWDGRGVWRVWGRGEVCTGFWWGNLRERERWGDPDIDGRIILRWIFRKWEGVVGTGWSWLRIGIGGGHLWVRWGTFGFQKCGEILD